MAEPLRTSPVITSLVADIEAHLATLTARRSTTPPSRRSVPGPREPSEDPGLELEAEIQATQRILTRLQQVETDKSLVGIYHDAEDLIPVIAEYPETIGEKNAGEYLKGRIGDALERLGINTAPDPATATASKPLK
jgi:hypothetical protein